jgi:hydroxyacylglutathione hydrolase
MSGKPSSEAEGRLESRLVAEKTWCINDRDIDNLYLVEGEERAAVIDTGIGQADMFRHIRTITALPLIAVNTHGHLDHAGGDYQFPEVHAHPSDFDLIRQVLSARDRPQPSLKPIREGDGLALGGRTLEVLETPGHTKGSIALLDVKQRFLFAGDDCNDDVWLFLKECLPLEVYLQTLRKLLTRTAENATLLPGHGLPRGRSFIAEQIVCAERILSGECRGEPYETFAGSGLLCKYQRAGIAYNPDNLYVRDG